MHRRQLGGRIVAASAIGLVGVILAPPGAAANPASDAPSVAGGEGPWIVSVGDSYISGEGGRWAGNSNESEAPADALGPTAYFDDAEGDGETIERCHRSRSAEVYLGDGRNGLNLACSGARTETHTDEDGYFKPGLDFYDDGAGNQGQAAMLRDFAADHDVQAVVVSTGGNEFGFGTVVSRCVLNFLTSPSWAKNFCHDDDDIESIFSEPNRLQVRAEMVAGLRNIKTAMRQAGYGPRSWTLIAQTYPSPLPDGASFRYPETGWVRQTTGGCGFWNADADWTNATVLPLINQTVREAAKRAKVKKTKILDISHAFDGRRLCEDTVGLYEEVGLDSWTDPAAVDRTEWINQIRITAQDGSLLEPADGLKGSAPSRTAAEAVGGSYYVQESLHPDYWAQLGLRSCLRQAYGTGRVRGGTCEIAGPGLVDGEPNMILR